MNKNINKSLLVALVLCSTFTMAWADGWKLKNSTVYGAGGYWENGQKTRIDCSYKNGQFKYERKVSSGNNMDVYSTKAIFSEPNSTYVAGEDINVRIEFTEKGERSGYTPYARVTVMPQHPNWSTGKGASNKISASGLVDGQAVDAAGRNTVTPPETVTLMAQACTGGSQMAIVYSCNGMDVVYLYDWDGEVVAQKEAEQSQENKIEEDWSNNEVSAETEWKPEEVIDNEAEDETEPYIPEENDYYNRKPKPILKFIIVGGVAALLIGIILFVFRNKKDKKPVGSGTQTDKQTVADTPKPSCPNCGAPVEDGEHFCKYCGCRLD